MTILPKRRVSKDWANTIKAIPWNILDDEQKRRTALRAEVTKIPDKVLKAELERRAEVRRNTPLELIY